MNSKYLFTISRKSWQRLCCLSWSQECESQTWPAPLLVTETFDAWVCQLSQVETHLLWIRLWWLAQGYGPQLSHGSWMYVFLLCLACGRVMASTYMRLMPESEPALHNIIWGHTELILDHTYSVASMSSDCPGAIVPPWKTEVVLLKRISSPQHWWQIRFVCEICHVNLWSWGGGSWSRRGDCDVDRAGIGDAHRFAWASTVVRKDT